MKFSQTFLGRRCPPALLACGRLLLQPGQRRRFLREIKIRREQTALIAEQYRPEGKNLVVYIVDGADWVTGREKISGGLLSIASMFEDVKKLPELAGYQVIMVTLDSSPLILRHTQFENNITVFRFSQVFSYFKQLQHLIINVPELLVSALPAALAQLPESGLARIEKLHLNILNQNILKMPGPEAVDAIKRRVPFVTMTTAHERYCTKELAGKYRVPTHNLSTFFRPELYRRRPFAQKDELMIVSLDDHPMKAAILDDLRKKRPGLTVQVIRNLTYGEYKATVERAKWAVTFGEGMDAYFLETVLSGGISFAVYNHDFFPKDFKGLPGVFDSYEQMRGELPAMIGQLDNPAHFAERQKIQFDLCLKYYQNDAYLKNLGAFYRGEYDIKLNGR